MNSIVRMLAVYAGLSLLLCGFTHLEWSPLQPNGFGQWFALFLLIFPAAAAAEFLGERLLGKRAPRSTSRRARPTATARGAASRPSVARGGGHHRRRDRRGLVAVASGGARRRLITGRGSCPSAADRAPRKRA